MGNDTGPGAPRFVSHECQGEATRLKILSKPHMTENGSYEFAIEDGDGWQIGIGRIVEKDVYFKDSNRGTPGNS